MTLSCCAAARSTDMIKRFPFTIEWKNGTKSGPPWWGIATPRDDGGTHDPIDACPFCGEKVPRNGPMSADALT